MGLILNIETATKVCSVALAKDGEVIQLKEMKSEKYSHSEHLTLFIEEVMTKGQFKYTDLDAIAVSQGPGSYTGLRIGTSTAKGLCYAIEKPLIAIHSLQALAHLVSPQTDFIIPMFDARRMEVYSAIYDSEGKALSEVQAVVVDEASYSEVLDKGQVLFVGPGAEKCQSAIQHPNAQFDLTIEVSAKGMAILAENKLNEELFEDVAYFEPFYLKEFIAGKPKKWF